MAKAKRRPRQSAVATSKPIDLAAADTTRPVVTEPYDPFETNRLMLEGLLAIPKTIKAHQDEQRRLQAEANAAAILAAMGTVPQKPWGQIGDEDIPPLDKNDAAILAYVNLKSPEACTGEVIAEAISLSVGTVRPRIVSLLADELVCYPKGPRQGVTVTDKGKKAAAKLTAD